MAMTRAELLRYAGTVAVDLLSGPDLYRIDSIRDALVKFAELGRDEAAKAVGEPRPWERVQDEPVILNAKLRAAERIRAVFSDPEPPAPTFNPAREP
jgi:hypothetical protein